MPSIYLLEFVYKRWSANYQTECCRLYLRHVAAFLCCPCQNSSLAIWCSLALSLSLEVLCLELWKCRLEFGNENDHVIKFVPLSTNVTLEKKNIGRVRRIGMIIIQSVLRHGYGSVVMVENQSLVCYCSRFFCCTFSCRCSGTSKWWFHLNFTVFSDRTLCSVA